MLGKFNVGETDRIYNFYTLEEGRVQSVGKGTRKPMAKLAGNLESITFCEVYISKKKGLGNITGAIAINNFLAIKANFLAISRVFWALSYFNKLITQQEKDERIFNLFLEYLMAMEKLSLEQKAEYKFDLVTLGFLFKLMEVLGYKIRMKYCVKCSKKIVPGNGNFFSAERGGTFCAECAKMENRKVKNSDSSIKLVKIFMKNKVSNLAKLEVMEKDLRELKLIWKELIDWI